MSDEIIVSREDWSLQRKGYLDQSRHKEKVQEAVKQQLGDLIVDESIILSDGKKAIKIPMRSLEEFRFRYDYNKKKNTGQSSEKVSPGDILGREAAKGKGNGNESGAGEEPGVDIYEAEITYDDLAEILFEELRLPNLDDKKRPKISHDRPEFNDVRKKGLMANVDKKRTLLESIKRQARESHGVVVTADRTEAESGQGHPVGNSASEPGLAHILGSGWDSGIRHRGGIRERPAGLREQPGGRAGRAQAQSAHNAGRPSL